MSKSQYFLSGLTTIVASAVFIQSYTTVAQAADKVGFEPNIEQKITTRQVALFLDRLHYLKTPLNKEMGAKVLSSYYDALDPNRTLFLQSDIDEFNKKYADTFADRLKRGDLSAGIEVYERYRTRSNEYYNYAKKFLAGDVNLKTNKSIILDREKADRFTDKKEQLDYWQNQITYALIGITLGKEEDSAKDKAFLENPDLTRGHDLVKGDERNPKEVLINRLSRQQGQLERIKNDEIMETILNTAMMTYDPHSNYFAPVQANELQIQSNLQLEGIGVSIRPDRKNPDYTKIVSLVDGGPAAKTGQVRANDLIIGVAQDGQPMVDVVGWSVHEIVSVIRGARGTSVTIRVKQPNTPDSSARNVLIVRDVIEQEESGVQHRVIDVPYQGKTKKVGVIEIPSFYLNFQARKKGESDYRAVSQDVEKALKELNTKKLDGLVVDLRNNPGGSLDEVTKMLGLFIKEGPLVQIRDNQGRIQVYKDEDGGKQLYTGDMVVLINLASASASEIFAATIQDYGRGLVVGSTTTGKGSAQVQRDDLALGSATLTQRKFYRVNGGSTQNKGVVPDIELVNIYEGMEIGEREYKNPLEWDTINSTDFKAEGKYSKSLIDSLIEKSNTRQKQNPQFKYLQEVNNIRLAEDDKKPVDVNIDKRRLRTQMVEKKMLMAENMRRQAVGEKPYVDWTTYQASIDALSEERSLLKENQRPKLPEDEAYVIEAATLMFDAKNTNGQK
ncbi:MAG: tail-specific protease [Moraxella sp.]|nr:MAG: tail-specific protease [Moraxella sp.]